MKVFFVILLLAGSAAAAEFQTGQAARALIGQPTFTAQNAGASEVLIGGASGLAIANDILFVADSNRVGSAPLNNRVLMFRNISSQIPRPDAQLFYTQRCPVCTGRADTVLGQPNFAKTDVALTQAGMRLPTAVASDGRYLAVADTDNNRILIWNRIPASSGTPADVVIGQPDFTKNATANPPSNKTMRGPQGVWIQNGRLFVADTQNHRVLVYNQIPTSNGATADVVIGQPDFNTLVEPDLTKKTVDASPSLLLNPVSVTSDGTRLFITDLGHNRVVIFNSIPTSNSASANIVIGQPDMVSSVANNAPKLCASEGKDDKGNDNFPLRCNATLEFPRYALSDGTRLFIADGGNDRVLVYKNIPTANGAAADAVVGQLGGQINQASDSTDSLRTPMSLAWDGTNLYVSDSYNRRIVIYSPSDLSLPYSAVRNAASREVYAVGGVTFAGTVKEADEATVTINSKDYKYKAVKDDTLTKIIQALVALINAGAGDPNVLASVNPTTNGLILTARAPGADGNSVTLAATASTSSAIVLTTSGATLTGGYDAAKIAPGTVVQILGDNLSEATASAPDGANPLPDELASTQVYFDGIRAPLFYVSPTQINAQVPFEVLDATSITAWVRTARRNGRVTYTTPVAVTIVPQNPGIFADDGPDPRPGVVLHATSNASGTVSVDGTIKAGDTGTVTINGRAYTVTVAADDTLATVRDKLVALINQDPEVEASAAGVFTRIRLRARVNGPDGNGIPYNATVPTSSQLLLTPTGAALCCANVAGSRVTNDNPAVPGETIIVYATGLGLTDPLDGLNTGFRFNGPLNAPKEFVSSLAGAKTANVLGARLLPGQVGVYEVLLELNSDIPTNPLTQLTIAQSNYVSNIVTFPLVNPNTP